MGEIRDLKYYKNNCEEDYLQTPISVLRYISELENSNKELLEALKKVLINYEILAEERFGGNFCEVSEMVNESKALIKKHEQ